MVNASWDVLEVAFVVLCWMETSKRPLEEIDGVFEGKSILTPRVSCGAMMSRMQRPHVCRSGQYVLAIKFTRIKRHVFRRRL